MEQKQKKEQIKQELASRKIVSEDVDVILPNESQQIEPAIEGVPDPTNSMTLEQYF